VTPPGTRAGHDISIEVALDAGVPIDGLASKTHEILLERTAVNRAVVRLKEKAVLPNKDFILTYDVVGRKIESAVLTHRAERGGFFTLILQPPERVAVEDVTPKEIVFVIDTSGSMSGFPIEKAKEAMKLALDGLYPRDTFNLITFAGDTHILFPEPVPATAANLQKAQEFLASRRGGGGTEMMKAIRAALDPSDAQGHIRIVCFMTDGYVGNDMEIIAEVQKHPNARVFSFGIGSSVNRFLLAKMAEYGRGEVEWVGLKDDGSAAARRFHERIRNPLLTDIALDWSGLPVSDIYPKRILDMFSARPVVVHGRYSAPAKGAVRVRGKLAGRDFSTTVPVVLPGSELRHDVLASLWARTRIEDLEGQDYSGIQQGAARTEVKEAITQLGLDYRLMTQFTSFVAVEEMIITEGGQPHRVEVPVEMPEGVSYEGVFGPAGEKQMAMPMAAPMRSGVVGGVAGGLRLSRGPAQAPVMVEATARDEERRVLSPAEQKLAKLAPALRSLLERSRKPGFRPTAEDANLLRNGKVEVQVFLTDTSEATLKQLRALGFEVVLQPTTAKLVIGRLPLEKLEALAELKTVRYVAPR
jgi:Ca-activated chloride channel family protein